MSESTALSIDNLSVRYPGQNAHALENINWSVPKGVLAAIIGPNGAGKSTLIKAAMDLIPRYAGTVQFFESPLSKVRQRVSYVPQRSSVDWDFPVSVLDVALMGLYGQVGLFRRLRKTHREQAMHALDQMGISNLANRQIGALSGGQQQRTFLARALVQNADLYLMDEPLAGIDASTQEQILELLQTLKTKGKTVVVVHHDLSTVNRIFDQAILLNKTKMTDGSIHSVLTHDYIQQAYGGHFSIMQR